MNIKTSFGFLSLLFLLSYVHAQEFLVAAGSSSGTYKQFLQQIQATIPDIIPFKEVDSHGAVENLDHLVNNECSAAFMHADVIFFRGQAENMSKYKTLLALFKEEVHFLALSTSKRFTTNISGGTSLFGRTIGSTETKIPVVFKSIEDLKGYNIGAAGGGYITARVIQNASRIPYNVIQYDKGDQVMAALNTGQIDAAVFVGGAPLPNLKDLGREYKLIPIPSIVADSMRQIYKPTSITYNKMSPTSVPTIAADCLFISKEYKTPKIVAQLKAFREAFYSHLDELKETPGNHRKWQEVMPDEKGTWPWLELNDVTVKK